LEKNNTIWGYTAILDYDKLNKKRYQMLLKRSHQPVTKQLLNNVLNREVKEKVKEMGVEYLDSIYTNGYYDWILTFIANDLKSAKKVVELYKKLYGGLFSEIRLNEEMFVVQKCGVDNPEIEKLKDFFTI
jgi:DNA-binding Lrp family transcriptional regulator